MAEEKEQRDPWGNFKRYLKLWGNSYKRIISLARPEWKTLLAATLFLALGSVLGLAAPQVVRLIVDGALTDGMDSINRAAGILMVIFFFNGIAVALRYYLFTMAGHRIVCDLKSYTYERIMNQEIGFFDRRKTGELMSRLASDTTVLQNTVTVNLSMVLRNSAMAMGGIGLLIYTSPMLAGLMLAVIPPVIIASLWAARHIRRLSKLVQDAMARAGEVAQETIAGVRTVRAFARESREGGRYRDAVLEALSALQRRTKGIAYFQGALTVAGYASVALVLWYGGSMVVEKTMSIGELTSFIIYTMIVAFSLSALGGLFTDFVSAAGAAERVFELMDRVPKINTTGGKILDKVRGELKFADVNFAYPTRPELAALRGIDFTIRPGEVVALVGPSGSGKSTIAALLTRFYDPVTGHIELDGQLYSELDPSWLRQRIGVVSQEPILFSTTIAANIGYGAENYTMKDIERAARIANAAEFIEAFPEGYETEVGERGVRLSGGQKQRVAIARAVLKDPEILILDEATSALDAGSEHLVKQALDRLMQNRTAIVIAHRLSTVKDADRVLVLKEGTLVEDGDHETLMRQPEGVYRQLVERQFVAEIQV